jgi:hypothetical protein
VISLEPRDGDRKGHCTGAKVLLTTNYMQLTQKNKGGTSIYIKSTKFTQKEAKS